MMLRFFRAAGATLALAAVAGCAGAPDSVVSSDPGRLSGTVVAAYGDLWLSHACTAGRCRDLLVAGAVDATALAEFTGERVRVRIERIDPCREGLADHALAGHTGLRVLAIEPGLSSGRAAPPA